MLLAIIAAVLMVAFGASKTTTPSKTSQPTAAETREARIERAFSAWDGSHRQLVSFVKRTMNDPKSFEHVETRFSDKGDHVYLVMQFRGKNAFGGTVSQTIAAKAAIDGAIIEIVDN